MSKRWKAILVQVVLWLGFVGFYVWYLMLSDRQMALSLVTFGLSLGCGVAAAVVMVREDRPAADRPPAVGGPDPAPAAPAVVPRLLTPGEVHRARIRTHRLVEGYDIDEVDRLLDDCEETIRVLDARARQAPAG